MKCSQALEWLEAAELNALPPSDPDVAMAVRHLESCPQCQDTWPLRRLWGERLSAAMQDVGVPDGLRARLLSAMPVAAENTPSVRSSRRRILAGASAVVAVAALSLIVGLLLRPQPTVSLEELQAAMAVDGVPLPEFRGAFDPRLPASWTAVFEFDKVFVRGFPPSGPARGQVALVPFQFNLRSDLDPLRGSLLMLRMSQLSKGNGSSAQGDEVADSFQTAQVRYVKGTPGTAAYLLWRENDLVFVCLMPSGPADLERFRESLVSIRSLT